MTSNHTGLINAVASYRRELQESIAELKRNLEAIQEQMTEVHEELRQLPSSEAMEDLTHQELADRVSGLIPELPEHLLDNETPACPGCSGASVVSDLCLTVRRCLACDGIFTTGQAITLRQASRFVTLDLPMTNGPLGNGSGQFYFDLEVFDAILHDGTVNRIHGWASKDTKRVVQFG